MAEPTRQRHCLRNSAIFFHLPRRDRSFSSSPSVHVRHFVVVACIVSAQLSPASQADSVSEPQDSGYLRCLAFMRCPAPCVALRCRAVRCCAVLCGAVRCCAVLSDSVRCYIALCCGMLCVVFRTYTAEFYVTIVAGPIRAHLALAQFSNVARFGDIRSCASWLVVRCGSRPCSVAPCCWLSCTMSTSYLPGIMQTKYYTKYGYTRYVPLHGFTVEVAHPAQVRSSIEAPQVIDSSSTCGEVSWGTTPWP